MYSKNDQSRLFKLTKNLLDQQVSPVDIDSLRDVLRYHEYKYYIENDPVLGDTEYDILFKKLERLEADQPQLITPDSPTQRVATDLSSDFDPVNHLTPMLSLDNSYNAEDLIDFDEQIRKLTQTPPGIDIEYCVEPKFDGGSVAMVYEADLLTRAATRGNGVAGEEITPNAKTLASVPLGATFSKHNIAKVELRGEAVIRKDIFEKVNDQREKDNQSIFANPRNAAAGGLRMKNPNETRKRGIEVFIFQMSYAANDKGDDMLATLDNHFDQIELLGDLGFKIPTIEKKKCKNIQEVISFIQTWEGKRDNYDYEIDGMVVKVNQRALQNQCGSTQHHPRWAIAYKFKAKQATTTLLNVEYQVGKVGSITPVAKVKPVQLAGVTVSSISLHNAEFIQTKDLRIGDQVLIERAGDVIPYIVKSLPDLRDGSQVPIEFPKTCPISKEGDVPLIQEEGEAAWRCPACTCGAQSIQKIIFHVSKNAMDIDGFGKSYVERFAEEGWLTDISDVYNLNYDQISTLDGFGSRSAQKLKLAIDKAKKNPIQKLLHSLSVHHLGKKASKLLAEQINHVLDLKSWTKEDFVDIKDIGPVVADNVIAFFEKEDNLALLARMEERGVNLQQTEEDKPLIVHEDSPLIGKSILFTGSLQTMGRKEAQKIAEENGARNISAVSAKLDILVVGEKAGSKLKKAQAIETIQVLTEEEFKTLLGL